MFAKDTQKEYSSIEMYKGALRNMDYSALEEELKIINRIAYDMSYTERHPKISAIKNEMAIRKSIGTQTVGKLI